MRWFIFRIVTDWLSYTFKPCPRLQAGYPCYRYRPEGCNDCGRGRGR
jgi:hypothetical protein